MRLLTNDDIERVLDMRAVIDALELAYRDLAAGEAANAPRVDLLVPHPERAATVHAFKTMSGGWPRAGVTALRLNSDVIQWPTSDDGRVTRQKVPLSPGGTYNGMVQLFSNATGELLAVFPDGVLQRLRVGATNGLAVRHLAREAASTVALIGSGWQAGAQAMAVCEVRDIEMIRVYSPTASRRSQFVADLAPRVAAEVVAVDRPEEAVAGADIVMLATNSLAPVLDDEWIRPGVLVTTIRGPEVDERSFARFDDVVVHTREVVDGHATDAVREQVPEFRRGEYRHSTSDEFDLAAARTLPEVVFDPTRGRQREEDAILFHNFCGLGLQFAAAGHVAHRQAVEAGLGQELPIGWFTQTVHP